MNDMNANDESVVTKLPNVAEENVFDASSLENTVDPTKEYLYVVLPFLGMSPFLLRIFFNALLFSVLLTLYGPRVANEDESAKAVRTEGGSLTES